MIDLSSSGRRRRSSHGTRIALLVALVLLTLMIWQPWKRGLAPELALVPAFTPTRTPAPASMPLTPTAAPTLSPTASPTGSPTAVSTAASGTITYTVVAGDTLSGLAKRFGVPLRELLEANALEEDVVLRVGQVLTIPTAEATPAPVGGMVVYEVQAGDTLSGIAAHFGVSIGDIMKANDITDPEFLQIGQVLRIPLGPPTPTSTPTLRPTPTPPPGPPLPAPVPLRPADGADLGEARYILLNWTAVRLLGEDQGYLVRLWREGAGGKPAEAGAVWTWGTSWRWGREICAGEGPQRFYWSVAVLECADCRRDAPGAMGEFAGEFLSPESPSRSFLWCGQR